MAAYAKVCIEYIQVMQHYKIANNDKSKLVWTHTAGSTLEEIREQVKIALYEANQETIISVMVEFTTNRKIIEVLMDTDEGTRQDIIENQNIWDEK